MADLLFIAVTVGFFAIATLLVRACDRIVGPDSDPSAPDGSADADVDADAVLESAAVLR